MISRYLLFKLGFCGLMKTLIEKAMKITCLCRLMKTTITQMMTAMQRTATTAPTIAPVGDGADEDGNTISTKPVPRQQKIPSECLCLLTLRERGRKQHIVIPSKLTHRGVLMPEVRLCISQCYCS